MSQKKKIIYRCPVCFARENDVVINKYDDGLYHCVKCSFFGTEEKIQDMYKDMKKKYTAIAKRITLEDMENDL